MGKTILEIKLGSMSETKKLKCDQCLKSKDSKKLTKCSIEGCKETRCKRCSYGYGYGYGYDSNNNIYLDYDHYFKRCQIQSSEKCTYDECYCLTHYSENTNEKVICCLCKDE